MSTKKALKRKKLLIGITVLSSLSFALTGCSESNNSSIVDENNNASELDGAIKENVKTISNKPRKSDDLTNITENARKCF